VPNGILSHSNGIGQEAANRLGPTVHNIVPIADGKTAKKKTRETIPGLFDGPVESGRCR